MKTEQLGKIIDRYLAGMATPEEKALLQKWFDKTADAPIHLSAAKQQRISREMWQQIKQPGMATGHPEVIPLFRRHLLKYAAAVFILAIASVALFSEKKLRSLFSTAHPLAYEQVTTEPGKIKTILLPDSSRVHLFPNSKISIPENYGITARTVLLEGRAFFDIQGNPKKQFTVQAGKLITSVLGTSFEINAFPVSTQMTVTVATGKVGVAYEGRLLGNVTPDEKLSYNISTTEVKTTNIHAAIACNWISGQLRFQQTPLKEACDILSEWFHVNITIDNPIRLKEQVTVGFRGESLEKILTVLSQTTGFTYTIDHYNIHIH